MMTVSRGGPQSRMSGARAKEWGTERPWSGWESRADARTLCSIESSPHQVFSGFCAYGFVVQPSPGPWGLSPCVWHVCGRGRAGRGEGWSCFSFHSTGDKQLGVVKAVHSGAVVPEEPYCYPEFNRCLCSKPSPVGVWPRRPGAEEEVLCPAGDPERLREQLHSPSVVSRTQAGLPGD